MYIRRVPDAWHTNLKKIPILPWKQQHFGALKCEAKTQDDGRRRSGNQPDAGAAFGACVARPRRRSIPISENGPERRAAREVMRIRGIFNAGRSGRRQPLPKA